MAQPLVKKPLLLLAYSRDLTHVLDPLTEDKGEHGGPNFFRWWRRRESNPRQPIRLLRQNPWKTRTPATVTRNDRVTCTYSALVAVVRAKTQEQARFEPPNR